MRSVLRPKRPRQAPTYYYQKAPLITLIIFMVIAIGKQFIENGLVKTAESGTTEAIKYHYDVKKAKNEQRTEVVAKISKAASELADINDNTRKKCQLYVANLTDQITIAELDTLKKERVIWHKALVDNTNALYIVNNLSEKSYQVIKPYANLNDDFNNYKNSTDVCYDSRLYTTDFSAKKKSIFLTLKKFQ